MKDKKRLDLIASIYSLLVEETSNELGFPLEDDVDELFSFYDLSDEEIEYIKGSPHEEIEGEDL